jgi:hypothetical protein
VGALIGSLALLGSVCYELLHGLAFLVMPFARAAA